MVWVRVLWECDELPRIVRAIAQAMKVERAPHGGCLRRGLDPRERICESHAPPPVHVDLHPTENIQGGGDPTPGIGDGFTDDDAQRGSGPG